MNKLKYLFLTLILTLGLKTSLCHAAEGYVIDDIQFPHFVMPEVGGLGFTPEGEIVIALRRHGIMMAKPIDDPKAFAWRVFAEDSLHNACGLHVISKDEVIVSQMPELTRIKDTDGDGIADSYITINDDWGISGNYHETNALIPDGYGGWYIAVGTASHNGPTFKHTRGEYSKMGRLGRNFASNIWKGWVLHVDKHGKSTPFASGFRANNGIGLSPDGQMFATDNQGDWRGTSPLYHVEKGKFYGHPSSLVWDKKFVKDTSSNPLQYYIDDIQKNKSKNYEADRTPAAVELPHGKMMNSPSEPHFITTDHFGPFKGQCLVGDIAGGRILRCMLEKVDGVMQGACVVFTGGLRAGNNRLVFSPDGRSLYTGQTVRGWGKPSEGLQRITYSGKVPFEIQNISMTNDGFKLTFTSQLSCDVTKEHFQIDQYFYKSTYQYGSKVHDKQQLIVSNFSISEDGKSISLSIPGRKQGRIAEINISEDVKSKTGKKLGNRQVCYTMNRLRN